MSKIGNGQVVVKVEENLEMEELVKEEEYWRRGKHLRCHIKVDIRRILCTMVLATGLLGLTAKPHIRISLGGFDSTELLAGSTARMDAPSPLSEASLQYEKLIDTTSVADLRYGEVRAFKPHGLATQYLYIEMSAYRGGPRVFSTVGLTSKLIETHHNPPYACEWVSSQGDIVKGGAHKIRPDWNYGKMYTVVVVTCTFAEDVGVDGEGGELILYASYGDQYRQPERIVTLTEAKGEYNASLFDPRNFPYDYVYCGSSVYGDISPQRMREWMAYHAKFFGEKSHFILHDAGGFHADVRKVLEPWIKQGRVTLQNIRQQELYDGYYHNQFMVVNDCLFRSRFMANWTFFFDIDEYMYVEPSTSLSDVLGGINPDATQITIQQVPFATGMCVADGKTTRKGVLDKRKWGLEKLVFQKVMKRGVHYDRKYAVQARHAEATGIHLSMNMSRGKKLALKGDQIRYNHYHGTITQRGNACSVYVDLRNKTALMSHGVRLDKTMVKMAKGVKSYEFKSIGTQPFIL